MTKRDAFGLLMVAALLGGVLAYRAAYVEPREWTAACAVAMPRLACVPRDALLWMQHWQLWGVSALGLGIWSLMGAPFCIRVAAVALGAVAVANYNATWGMLGLALGGWAWVAAGRLDQREYG